jgi:hypothetical protein
MPTSVEGDLCILFFHIAIVGLGDVLPVSFRVLYNRPEKTSHKSISGSAGRLQALNRIPSSASKFSHKFCKNKPTPTRKEQTPAINRRLCMALSLPDRHTNQHAANRGV